MGPSSQISKIILLLLFFLISFFIYMDIMLYIRIQNYSIERECYINLTKTESDVIKTETIYEKDTILTCDINPLCHVTVKALLLDHTNHYLFAPLASVFEKITNLASSSFITANMISFFHVGVACISGKLVASTNIGYRRFGVVLFEVRTFLDDLDGHVARVKKHIKGEHSEIGSLGYYIDGICDGLGIIALLFGIFFYLKSNPPRRGYLQLPLSESSHSETRTRTKTSTLKVAKKLLFFTGQLILSSTAWNRYIAVYQRSLESSDVSTRQCTNQVIVIRSTWFLSLAWIWRLVNVHSLLHGLLLSIFWDKLWEFLKAVQYIGYFILLIAICITEMHIMEVHNFIYPKTTKSYAL